MRPRSRPCPKRTARAARRSSSFIHPAVEVLIGGTFYAGEIKKSIFTVMNDHLPLAGVLPMHCSANVGDDGRVAIFFGLSGTGKTTLSADPERSLIGDDEHGWGDTGVFNIEGGCYAKVIRLSAEAEPEIFRTTRSVRDGARERRRRRARRPRSRRRLEDREHAGRVQARADRDTRCREKRAGHPDSVVFLTADAFGILPPIARLTRDQALYWFLSGFTAKLAGTEIGVKEPQPTFSTCFGAPFLPQPPSVYARMLGEKLERAPARPCGSSTPGGRAGRMGRASGCRSPPRVGSCTRRSRVVSTVSSTGSDEVFGFEVPVEVPGVDARLLDPRSTWRDPSRYDSKARQLAAMFRDNFAAFAEDVGPEIAAAGPRI